MEARVAQCHCGQLRLTCAGAPKKISMCHCPDCQRRTGSAFSIAVFYDRDRARRDGVAPQMFERASASGYPVAFFFCPHCGSNLFWEPRRMPELVGVAWGAFADPHFSAPQQSVWTGNKADWLSLPDDMTCFDLLPPPRTNPAA